MVLMMIGIGMKINTIQMEMENQMLARLMWMKKMREDYR